MKGPAILMALAIAVLLLLATGVGASPQSFVDLTNESRAAAGLPALHVDSQLSAYAESHSDEMVAANDLYHSSANELRSAAGDGWSAIAENVGRGNTPQSLHDAFMDSSGHRVNILGDYTHIGAGTATAEDGRLYVTVVFKRAAPTTTTTVPPTTTTTAAPTTTTERQTTTTVGTFCTP